MECSACKAVYSLTSDAIGKTAKCRCGHRFAVTGPSFTTIPAGRASLNVCPHCRSSVIASQDALRAMVLCCHCGKMFQADSAPRHQVPQSALQPQGAVPERSMPDASGSDHANSVEASIRAIVDEWQQPHLGSTCGKEPSSSAGPPRGIVADSPSNAPQEMPAVVYRSGRWTVFRCPGCGRNTAFVTSDTKSECQCALCSEHVFLRDAEDSREECGLGDPERWMKCLCPRCGVQIAVDEAHRGSTIRCPTCSNTFRAPFGELAAYHPPVYHSSPPTAYVHRPLPVRSYRKKNGTWVEGHRRSRPRKRR